MSCVRFKDTIQIRCQHEGPSVNLFSEIKDLRGMWAGLTDSRFLKGIQPFALLSLLEKRFFQVVKTHFRRRQNLPPVSK